MKRLVEVATDEKEFDALAGQQVLLMCENYFYTGKLVRINDTHVILASPQIVYETGPWDTKGFADAQALPAKEWCIRKNKIESYGVVDE